MHTSTRSVLQYGMQQRDVKLLQEQQRQHETNLSIAGRQEQEQLNREC